MARATLESVREAAGIPFGSYRLLRRLARGGMAEVFLARQSGLEGFDRLVALKRILPHLADSAEFVRMFFDEARVASQLSHPNVVHIYEFGKVDEDHFIAMEWVDGVHAGQLTRSAQRLPDVLVARIGADACAGLHYAHAMRDASGRPLRLVHRDVSPANLIVSFDGAVKLVDFGIAKAVSCVEKTRPGVVKGKYAYMSPEQTVGNKLDGRSDVYSLAIVLWELLAGRVMIPREDPVEAMRMIRDDRLPPIEEVRPDIPPALAAALGRALVNDREARATALDLGLALESFIKAATGGTGSSLELASWISASFPRAPTADGEDGDEPPATRPVSQATAALPDDSLDHTLIAGGFAAARDDLATVVGATDAPIPTASKWRPLGSVDSIIVDHSLGSGSQDEVTRAISPRGLALRELDTPADRAPAFRPHAATVASQAPGGFESGAFTMLDEPSSTDARPTWDDATYADTLQPRHTELIAGLPPRPELAPSAPPAPARPRRPLLWLALGAGALVVVGVLGARLDDAGPATAGVPGTAPPGAMPDAGPGPATTDAATATATSAPTPPRLEIVSHPPGALAVIKPGDRRITTPARVDDLAPGAYVVELTLTGHLPTTHQIILAAGEHRTLDLPLQPAPTVPTVTPLPPTPTPGPDPADERAARTERDRARPKNGGERPRPATPGSLTVRTRPASEVFLGQRKLGATPLAGLKLAPGEYQLTFRHRLFRPQQRRVVIRPGQATKLDFELD